MRILYQVGKTKNYPVEKYIADTKSDLPTSTSPFAMALVLQDESDNNKTNGYVYTNNTWVKVNFATLKNFDEL